MESGNVAIKVRASFLAKHLQKHNVLSATTIILYDLRFPVNYDGFRYLKIAIPHALQNPSQMVASEIYDAVSEQYSPKAAAQNVGVAIHEIIDRAWQSQADDRWSWYLPDYLMERQKSPSNLEFISAIVNFLELWQDCYDKEVAYERA